MPLKPNHYRPFITDEQRCNLIKLAHGLLFGGEERKSNFGMRRYFVLGPHEINKGHELTPANYNTCGTVACAAGHGPLYVTPKLSHEDWVEYSSRVFINFYSGDGTRAYHWCFAGNWANTDNTPEGAAKRILYMLKFGVPNYVELTSEEAVALYSNLTLEELDPCTEEPSHVQA